VKSFTVGYAVLALKVLLDSAPSRSRPGRRRERRHESSLLTFTVRRGLQFESGRGLCKGRQSAAAHKEKTGRQLIKDYDRRRALGTRLID
jgi:hypothetical protein